MNQVLVHAISPVSQMKVFLAYSSFSRCVTVLSPEVLLLSQCCTLSLFSTTTMTKSTYAQVEKVIFPKWLALTCLRKQTAAHFYQALATWPERQLLISKKVYLVFQVSVLYETQNRHNVRELSGSFGSNWVHSKWIRAVVWDIWPLSGRGLPAALWLALKQIVNSSGYSAPPRICQNQLEGALKNFHYHNQNVK